MGPAETMETDGEGQDKNIARNPRPLGQRTEFGQETRRAFRDDGRHTSSFFPRDTDGESETSTEKRWRENERLDETHTEWRMRKPGALHVSGQRAAGKVRKHSVRETEKIWICAVRIQMQGGCAVEQQTA
jgi:hypothetical protein